MNIPRSSSKLFIIFCLLLLLLSLASRVMAMEPVDEALFREAMTRIREQSMEPESYRNTVHSAIKGYLHDLDSFSDFLTPAEYERYKEAKSGSYAGVGMDIFRDRDGTVLCVPFPDGPALSGGVKYGDSLLYVDSRDTEDVSVYVLGSMIRGEPGSTVQITVRDAQGLIRNLNLVREEIQPQTIGVVSMPEYPVIRIYSFNRRTPDELIEVLARFDPAQPLVIDLRGNTGGDLRGATDCASIFLEQGKLIVSMKTRKKTLKYVAAAEDKRQSELVLWQDELTASAAEVFIAALKENGRAVTVGTTTFGKGVAQGITELSDGSAMFVTNGALITPSGELYHEKGLEPTFAIGQGPGFDDEAYNKVTQDIFRSM